MRYLIVAAMLFATLAALIVDSDAGGRPGSTRSGGVGSHGKGSHYIGGRNEGGH